MTNEQIATEVMGWRVEGPDDDRGFTWYSDDGGKLWSIVNNLPDFLNDHNAAMMVVEKMREDEYVYEVDEAPASRDYHVMFYNIDEHLIGEIDATSESLCHAICEAALKAKGG